MLFVNGIDSVINRAAIATLVVTVDLMLEVIGFGKPPSDLAGYPCLASG
jgi:hypothetical protein